MTRSAPYTTLTDATNVRPPGGSPTRVAEPRAAPSSARVRDGRSPTSPLNVTLPEKFNSASVVGGKNHVDKPNLELGK